MFSFMTFLSKQIVVIFFLTFSFIGCASAASNQPQTANPYFPHQQLPKQNPVPGGVVVLAFEHTHKNAPDVLFQNKRIMVLNTDTNQWVAVIGLPLSLKTGQHHALLGDEKLFFTVHDKAYESQYITLANKNQVNPSSEELARIAEESRIMRSAFRSWSQQTPSTLQLAYPVEGRLSSPFGLRRFFNNEERNPHSGLDIAAPTGTPISNPLEGEVIATGNYFFNGKTVLIDHGQGLVTMYCHMDEIKVTKGQQLQRGEMIGTVGSSGRATGPHLHWSVNLNDTRIDPLLFLIEP